MEQEFKEKLEYALTQACTFKPGDSLCDVGQACDVFENVIEECCKLGLLPNGAYKRLAALFPPS